MDATAVLIKFTYGGDATLDGKISIDDSIQIDNGIASQLPGWRNGDFNYDGKINIDDYTIIDSNIATQGPPISDASALTSLAWSDAGIGGADRKRLDELI